MDNKNDILKQLEELKKENPYKVPDNYFDTFTSRLKDRIAEIEEPKPAKSYFFRLKPYYAVSFMVLAVAFIAYLSVNVIFTGPKNNNVLSNDEIAAYFNNAPQEIDESMLMEQLNQTKHEPAVQNQQNDTINYLLNADIDDNDILSEL